MANATATPAAAGGMVVSATSDKPDSADMDEYPGDTPEGAARELARYFATNDADERSEIISELQGMTVPEAAQTVARILPSEADPDLKTQLIGVLADAEANIDLKLNALAPLVREGQQADVREAAVNALDQIEDTRALPIWQSLLNDKDEDIRQMAEDAIDRLK